MSGLDFCHLDAGYVTGRGLAASTNHLMSMINMPLGWWTRDRYSCFCYGDDFSPICSHSAGGKSSFSLIFGAYGSHLVPESQLRIAS